MTAAVVEIDNVTKAFDDIVAVDHVSLRLHEGQTLGLIGPNGAGKTTLLRIVASLARPDQGNVRIQGESVRDQPRAVRRMLGFMPAESGHPRSMTIAEYLDYFGCLYGLTPNVRRQRARDVCELTELSGREDIMVKGLSTGNRQRLLLAKTLLHDPAVLILDEPASGLDPRARTELRGILRTLASLGKTIIVSSHILPDIEDVSDRIGILEAGKLVLDGDLNTLRSHFEPANRLIRLRVPASERSRAAEAIGRLDGVLSCEEKDQFLVIRSDEPDGNFVLAEMLRSGIRVMQFAESEPDLEEIFLKSTLGKVT